MLVRLKTSLVWYGRPAHDGEEIDLPESAALAFIKAGSAEAVDPPIETAAELTAAPKGKRYVRNAAARS